MPAAVGEEDPPIGIRQRMRSDLKGALRRGDRTAVSVLRAALAAIDNAEAVPLDGVADRPVVGLLADVARQALDEDDMVAIVRGQHQERTSAAALYERHGRVDHGAQLRAEAAILEAYL